MTETADTPNAVLPLPRHLRTVATLDLDDAADFLKIERTYALKLAGAGVLPGAKIGKAWVFLESDLVQYLHGVVLDQQRARMLDQQLEDVRPRKRPGPNGARPLPTMP